ncbi:MAG: hypothetical protein HYT48_03015, partial [Candidatus Vogelbacteria bacterium]|nr:hypothetical protein [Candidatus Vogelbacteria bacterium]
MLKRHALFGCLVFVGLFFVAGQASAKSFNDAATGNWNDGATWGLTSPGVEGTDYPGTNDRAVIDSHTVTMTGNQSVASTTIAGGTLTMSSNTLTVSNLNGSGTVAASTVSVWAFTSGTFNADTGKVTLTGGGTVADTTTFNQLEFGPTAANRTYVITSGKTLTVNATTTISGTVVATINTGTIDAKGDINITNTGVATSLVGGGTATITLTGTENQIVTGSGTTRQGT